MEVKEAYVDSTISLGKTEEGTPNEVSVRVYSNDQVAILGKEVTFESIVYTVDAFFVFKEDGWSPTDKFSVINKKASSRPSLKIKNSIAKVLKNALLMFSNSEPAIFRSVEIKRLESNVAIYDDWLTTIENTVQSYRRERQAILDKILDLQRAE